MSVRKHVQNQRHDLGLIVGQKACQRRKRRGQRLDARQDLKICSFAHAFDLGKFLSQRLAFSYRLPNLVNHFFQRHNVIAGHFPCTPSSDVESAFLGWLSDALSRGCPHNPPYVFYPTYAGRHKTHTGLSRNGQKHLTNGRVTLIIHHHLIDVREHPDARNPALASNKYSGGTEVRLGRTFTGYAP